MVRRNMFKINIICSLVLSIILSIALVFPTNAGVFQDAQLEVGVDEVLVVSITTPSSGASGAVGDFLRNTVHVEIASNNSDGLSGLYALMSPKNNNANLTNTISGSTIPTLASDASRSSFPNDRWGYSLKEMCAGDLGFDLGDPGDTDAGLSYSIYKPLTSSITVMHGCLSQDIYFGTKVSSATTSGTYLGTVVISVVSGVQSGDSPDPVNPVTPIEDTVANNNTGTYVSSPAGDSNSGATVYNYTSSSVADSTNTETTVVAEGDTHDVTYTPPQGVSSVSEGTPLATGLAITAAIAATSGTFFFALAKRAKNKEDAEDEDYYDY